MWHWPTTDSTSVCTNSKADLHFDSTCDSDCCGAGEAIETVSCEGDNREQFQNFPIVLSFLSCQHKSEYSKATLGHLQPWGSGQSGPTEHVVKVVAKER